MTIIAERSEENVLQFVLAVCAKLYNECYIFKNGTLTREMCKHQSQSQNHYTESLLFN